METTSFILGVGAVILVLMAVFTFMNYITLKTLKKAFETDQINNQQVTQDLYKTNETTQGQLDDRINQVEDGLYRHIDSRVDKVINELERIKRTYIKEY